MNWIRSIPATHTCRANNFDGVESRSQVPFDCVIEYDGDDGMRQSFVVNIDAAAEYRGGAGDIKDKRDRGVLVPPLPLFPPHPYPKTEEEKP